MDRILNAQIRELCSKKRIDEGVLRWFGHEPRMEKARIAKRVYVVECAGSGLVCRLWKRWIDTVKECLQTKRGFGCQVNKENGAQ